VVDDAVRIDCALGLIVDASIAHPNATIRIRG
jgi:hypothetical protein